MSRIEGNIDDALEWWGDESIVGETEMHQVYLLLLITDKINADSIKDYDMFMDFCKKTTNLPKKYYKKITN